MPKTFGGVNNPTLGFTVFTFYSFPGTILNQPKALSSVGLFNQKLPKRFVPFGFSFRGPRIGWAIPFPGKNSIKGFKLVSPKPIHLFLGNL